MVSLRDKLDRREKIFATTSAYVGWTGIIKQMKNDVLDFIMFDMEHGNFGIETAENMLRTCNMLKVPAIVRTVDTEYHLITKYLDFGADGILVPRVETVYQAKKAIEFIRFPPKGKKGCGGYSLLRGQAFEDFNRDRLLMLQIESPIGIENLQDMLTMADGEVDAVIVGPTDLSIAMGKPFEFEHPAFIDNVRRVIKICEDSGLSVGIFCGDDNEITRWRQEGMNILWAGGDIGLYAKAYGQLCRFMKEIE